MPSVRRRLVPAGSLKVSNRQIPALFWEGHALRSQGWYEEDCDYVIPLYFFADGIRDFCLKNGLGSMSTNDLKAHFEKHNTEWLKTYLHFWFMAECAVYFDQDVTDQELQRRNISREDLEQKINALKALYHKTQSS